MHNNLRIKKYNKLVNEIIYFDEDKITNITKKNKSDNNLHWGDTGVISILNTKVFYKKLPLAKKFYNSGITTSNLYNLPSYYNYGIGTAGINPWRELVTQINLSNFVVQGEIHNFPLLYHWRVIKDNIKTFESGLSKKLLDRFSNNKNIIKYLQERYECEYKIIMFLEFIPNVLYKYVEDNPSYIKKYIKESEKILNFLKSKGILHIDAHWGNYLVDSDSNLYITDFGLVLDKKFILDKNEKEFMNKNIKLPYYYSNEAIYEFIYFYVERKHKKINELIHKNLENNLDNNLDKFICFIILFIKSIDYIIKICKLPKIYAEVINQNQQKIIKLKLLKYSLKHKKNKNIYITDKIII